jgi:hypothetical protein
MNVCLTPASELRRPEIVDRIRLRLDEQPLEARVRRNATEPELRFSPDLSPDFSSVSSGSSERSTIHSSRWTLRMPEM